MQLFKYSELGIVDVKLIDGRPAGRAYFDFLTQSIFCIKIEKGSVKENHHRAIWLKINSFQRLATYSTYSEISCICKCTYKSPEKIGGVVDPFRTK